MSPKTDVFNLWKKLSNPKFFRNNFCRKVFCIDFEILPTNLASLEAIKEKQTNLKVLSLKTCVFNLWKKDLILEFLGINLNLDFKNTNENEYTVSQNMWFEPMEIII